MKKALLVLITAVLALLCAALPASAALTQKQQETFSAYVEKFIADANKAEKVIYGSVNNHLGINLFLNEVTSSTPTASYHIPATSKKTIPGNYLVLDCSAFYELMYREVFGIQMTYVYRGMYSGGHHASNWPSRFFFLGQDEVEWQNENILKVTSLSGEMIDLYKVVYKTSSPQRYISVNGHLGGRISQMQVGDGIIGYNRDNDWGHYMIYAGDGCVWHSTSTDINKNGSIYPYTLRKQEISTLTNASYTEFIVVRLNDGILEPDFAGYNVPVNFASLSTSSSSFDKNPPYFESIDVKKNGSYYELTVKASDSYGKLKPLSYWYEPDVVFKTSGQGESGILGIFMNRTGETPEICYAGTNKSGASSNAFVSDKTTKKTITRVQTAVQILNEIGDVYTDGSVEHTNLPLTDGKTADGRTIKYNAPLSGTSDDTNYGPRLTNNVNYYLWCKDAAQNISTRLRIRFENGICRIWSSPESGEETLLARYFTGSGYPIARCDVDVDGKVNVIDALRVAAHLAGRQKLLSDSLADTDGNGQVTVNDILTVLGYFGSTPEI